MVRAPGYSALAFDAPAPGSYSLPPLGNAADGVVLGEIGRPTLWVGRDYAEDGRYLGSMSHILRVFLIDAEGRIRNIYSPSFLHADLLAADIETLLRERRADNSSL